MCAAERSNSIAIDVIAVARALCLAVCRSFTLAIGSFHIQNVVDTNLDSFRVVGCQVRYTPFESQAWLFQDMRSWCCVAQISPCFMIQTKSESLFDAIGDGRQLSPSKPHSSLLFVHVWSLHLTSRLRHTIKLPGRRRAIHSL